RGGDVMSLERDAAVGATLLEAGRVVDREDLVRRQLLQEKRELRRSDVEQAPLLRGSLRNQAQDLLEPAVVPLRIGELVLPAVVREEGAVIHVTGDVQQLFQRELGANGAFPHSGAWCWTFRA